MRVSLDVTRDGLVERARAFVPERLVASIMLTVGWLAFFPQGVVAAAMSIFDGPQSWLLAMYLEGPERWLVIVASAGAAALSVR